jgi:hypothetical protein
MLLESPFALLLMAGAVEAKCMHPISHGRKATPFPDAVPSKVDCDCPDCHITP